jgi:hypothetical protein
METCLLSPVAAILAPPVLWGLNFTYTHTQPEEQYHQHPLLSSPLCVYDEKTRCLVPEISRLLSLVAALPLASPCSVEAGWPVRVSV